MKKTLLFFSVVFLLPCMLFAQKQTIFLNGNVIELTENFQEAKKEMKKTTPENKHFILQFKSIPDLKEQKELKEKGITLLNYLGANTYFVSLNSKFYSLGNRDTKNINSLLKIKPEYKISADLSKDNIPEHARVGGSKVKVFVKYFNDVEEIDISSKACGVSLENANIDQRFKLITAVVLIDDLKKLASMDCIQYIEPVPPPAEFMNDHERTLHRANVLNSDLRGLGYELTGKGVTVGLWDGDVYNHRDFNDRVKVREFEMHNTDHGTHTAGTVTGAGLIDPKAEGMAPEANMVSWNFNVQSNGLWVPNERIISLNEDGMEISSNSYGYYVKTCPNPFAYNVIDQMEDNITVNYPYFLMVYSGGNDQRVCGDGYYTTSKNIKNSLIVAAVNQLDEISSFSSFGPSKDGRLIPNISGDGVNTYSTFFDNGYGIMSGTSMATPGVAGTMTLVYQRYKETHSGTRPVSSLMRALACNTAYDLGNPGPDYIYGYGEINGLRAVQVMEQNHYFTDSVAQGTIVTKDIVVPEGATELKIMLAWTDLPGTPGSSKILVNDLDLSVTNGGTTTLPWVLDFTDPTANAQRKVDTLNNFEQVTIENPVAGTYTIRIDGSEIPNDKQEFAVVYDVVMPELTLTYPIGKETIAPGLQQVIRWDCYGYNQNFDIEYSLDSGATYQVIASNIPSDKRSYLWNVPSEVTKNAKIRVSNGSVLDESNKTFEIMAVPQNVSVSTAQCSGAGPFTLQWDAVANAKYEVLQLNGQVYEHLAEVTTTNYDITGLNKGKNNWFCVKAIDLTNGAISERSIAVNVNPAEAVLSLPFKEEFESQKADNFYFTGNKGQGNVRYVNDAQKYGIRLEGTSGATADWVDATGADCFTNNPDYVVSASICNIDASSFAGKKFRMKFDYRLKYRLAPGTSYLRVKVNGTYLTNFEGDQIYGAASQVSYKTVYYDLTPYAGESSVSIEFEAVCKTGYTTYINDAGNYDFSNDNYDTGDFVTIDNIEIFEPENDVALLALNPGMGMTNAETIEITVQNFNGEEVSEIPVAYSINNGTAVLDTIEGPVAPMAKETFVFNQNADFSVAGLYVIQALVNLENDVNNTNNAKQAAVANNGTDILLGSKTSDTTCNAVVTDPSGRYFNYENSQTVVHTFVPGEAGKNVSVTFTEFSLEKDYDYLYIYNGNSTSSADLLGVYTGNVLMPVITSTAKGGQITFKFTADDYTVDKGFIANIACVDKPSADPEIIGITSPVSGVDMTSTENITISLMNNGIQDLTDLDVYYQINSEVPVHEVLPALDSLAEVSYTFTQQADLSAYGTYKIKTWLDYTGDTDETNNIDSVMVTNTQGYVDASIASINTILPGRENSSAIIVKVKNNGNLSINNFDIAYRVNNGAEQTQTITEALASGEVKTDTFTVKYDFTALNTTYQVKAYTKLAGDTENANDTVRTTVVTPQNSATNVVGTFYEKNEVLVAENRNLFSLTNDYTFECWLKPNIPSGFAKIFRKGNVILYYNYYAGSSNYGLASYILVVYPTVGGVFICSVPGSVSYGNWQHIALTVSSANEYKFYINGQEKALIVANGVAVAAHPYAGAMEIGDNVPASIDELRVWNSALNQATISGNMMTDYPANTAGLHAYYKFIEGEKEYVYDYSANDNTARITDANTTNTGADQFWNTPGFLLNNVSMVGEKIPTTFNPETNTFNSIMDAADLSTVVTEFDTTQQSVIKVASVVQESGVTSNNFSGGALTYTAEGFGFNAGISQTYTVDVRNDLSSDCELNSFTFELADNPALSEQITLVNDGNNYYKKITAGTNVSSLKASFTTSANATVYINNVLQTSPQTTALDYTKPVMVKVVAENGRVFKNYNIFVDTRYSLADLTAFDIVDEQTGNSDLNSTEETVDIWVKNNTDVTALKSIFETSPNANLYLGSVLQQNAITANNYTGPLTYTVVSEDESATSDWTVTVVKDEVKPVITLIGEGTVDVFVGDTYTDKGATATDNVNGDISSSIVKTGTVDTNTEGEYKLKYNVSDDAGNAADEKQRVVNVKKNPNTFVEEVESSDIMIIPNPAKSKFKINTNLKWEKLVLYNALGVKMNEWKYSNEFDISNLPEGMYFINLFDKEGNQYPIQKLIKQ